MVTVMLDSNRRKLKRVWTVALDSEVLGNQNTGQRDADQVRSCRVTTDYL